MPGKASDRRGCGEGFEPSSGQTFGQLSVIIGRGIRYSCSMGHGLDIRLIGSEAGLRQCGSCTACCDGWLKTEINGELVTVGKPCRHSTPGGCAIYATRPHFPCREFNCGWIRPDSTLPGWMRPDECGAIVFLWFEWQGQHVINAVPVGDRIPQRTLDWLMAHAREQKRPLIYTEHLRRGKKYVGARYLAFGPPAFVNQVEQMKQQREQAKLLEMYNPG